MRKHVVITAAVGGVALLAGAIVIVVARACDEDRAQGAYEQTNLVSNRTDVRAKVTDRNLQNPWGLAAAPGGPLWVANNGSSTSTVYTLKNDVPNIVNLVVKLAPHDKPTEWKPTGIVWNPSANQFKFRGGKFRGDKVEGDKLEGDKLEGDKSQGDKLEGDKVEGDKLEGDKVEGDKLEGDKLEGDKKKEVAAVFIFASEDGRIVAWNPNANEEPSIANTVVRVPDAIYKGLAFATAEDGGNMLFATNFHAGTVDVFDANFKQVTRIRFVDRDIPPGFAPFGIATIEHELFVSFAKQDKNKEDDVAGAGLGFVDVFTPNGVLVRRLVSRGALDAPWGMVRAPLGFGRFGGAFLIGNFGDGKINAFDNRGSLLGTVRSANGQPIVINGLWALMFDTFQGAGTEDLYFSAGINDEKDGLVGEIAVASGRH